MDNARISRELVGSDLSVGVFESREQGHLPLHERLYDLVGAHDVFADMTTANLEGIASDVLALFAAEREAGHPSVAISGEDREVAAIGMCVSVFERGKQSHLPISERQYELCGTHYSIYDVSGADLEGLATGIQEMFARERENLAAPATEDVATPKPPKRGGGRGR